VDGLLGRLLTHAGTKLNDDVALLLLEATSPPFYPENDSSPASAPSWSAGPDGRPLAAAARAADPAAVRQRWQRDRLGLARPDRIRHHKLS
jgi:hypothetical protein